VLRDTINGALHGYLDSEPECAALPFPEPESYIDFSTNTLFQEVATLLRDNFPPVKANALIESFTTKQSGVAGRLQVTSKLISLQYDATSLGVGFINASVSPPGHTMSH